MRCMMIIHDFLLQNMKLGAAVLCEIGYHYYGPIWSSRSQYGHTPDYKICQRVTPWLRLADASKHKMPSTMQSFIFVHISLYGTSLPTLLITTHWVKVRKTILVQCQEVRTNHTRTHPEIHPQKNILMLHCSSCFDFSKQGIELLCEVKFGTHFLFMSAIVTGQMCSLQ